MKELIVLWWVYCGGCRRKSKCVQRSCVVQVRGEGGQHARNTGQWFCFDDNSVEPWDVANLDADCFGGKYTVEMQEPLLPGPKARVKP